MNIVHVTGALGNAAGGVSVVVWSILKLFPGSTVIGTADAQFKSGRYDCDGIKVVCVNTVGPKVYGFAPGLVVELLRANPDIIHVHGVWRFHCLAVLIWALITRRPYVITPHGMLEYWICQRSKGLKSLVSALYQNAFLRNAGGIHILTEKEGIDVAPFVGAGQVVSVVPNYVDLIMSNGVSPPPWWRAEYAGRRVYLFFGRIHQKKSVLEICDAWSRICSGNRLFAERSLLVFCGWVDGLAGFDDKVKLLASNYGNALYAGPQYNSDKVSSFQYSDVLLLPSKSEGLPMALLEAWAYGLPAIISDACNIPRAISDRVALSAEPNEESIAASLLKFSNLTDIEIEDLSQKSQKFVGSFYSPEIVKNGLAELYEKVCN